MLGKDWGPASPTPAPGGVQPEWDWKSPFAPVKIYSYAPVHVHKKDVPWTDTKVHKKDVLNLCIRAQTTTPERGDYLPGCEQWLFWGELEGWQATCSSFSLLCVFCIFFSERALFGRNC